MNPYSAFDPLQATIGATQLPGPYRVAAIVKDTAIPTELPPAMEDMYVATINAGLAKCTANKGDIVLVYPGHTEALGADAFAACLAGTQIIGLGYGTLRPALTWSASGSTVVMDIANVRIANMILNMEPGTGSVAVAAPITVSAAGFILDGCSCRTSTDANNKTTIALTTAAGADDMTVKNCHFYGATAGECTVMMEIIGADRLVMTDNIFEGATSNATDIGVVRFGTTASLNIRLERNTYINRKALSTCAVTGHGGASGVSKFEHFAYLDTASLTPWVTATGLMTFHRPTVTNTAGEVGTEVVGTVSA